MLFFVCYVGYEYAMCNFTPNKSCYVIYCVSWPLIFKSMLSTYLQRCNYWKGNELLKSNHTLQRNPHTMRRKWNLDSALFTYHIYPPFDCTHHKGSNLKLKRSGFRFRVSKSCRHTFGVYNKWIKLNVRSLSL